MKYFAARELVELAGIILCRFWSRRNKLYDLIIIKNDRIGDYVIWHDTISAYKEKYKGQKVLLICNDTVLSLAKQEDFFTDILSFKLNKIKKSPIYAYKFFNQLKGYESETVINPIWERTWFADIMTMAIKSKNKVSFLPKVREGRFSHYYDRQYTKLVDCHSCTSEIEADSLFVQKMIKDDYQYGNYPLTVQVASPIKEKKYVAISFSSSALGKNWPLERFVEVINQIPDDYKVVLIGAGVFDQRQAKTIEDNTTDKSRVINLVNKTSVAEMVALIANASFVLGNDSGAVHIAAAVHVPSVAVVPGVEFYRFLPYPKEMNIKYAPRVVANLMKCYNCKYNCIYPDKEPFECIKRVTTEMVVNEMNELIKGE